MCARARAPEDASVRQTRTSVRPASPFTFVLCVSRRFLDCCRVSAFDRQTPLAASDLIQPPRADERTVRTRAALGNVPLSSAHARTHTRTGRHSPAAARERIV